MLSKPSPFKTGQTLRATVYVPAPCCPDHKSGGYNSGASRQFYLITYQQFLGGHKAGRWTMWKEVGKWKQIDFFQHRPFPGKPFFFALNGRRFSVNHLLNCICTCKNQVSFSSTETCVCRVRSRAGGGGRVKTHTIWILSHKYINELGWAPLLGGGTLSHIREGLFRTRHPCFRPQIPGSTFQAP